MAFHGAKNGSAEALDLASTVPVRAALLTATVRKIAGRGLWDGEFGRRPPMALWVHGDSSSSESVPMAIDSP